jgi:hypothetical protein
MATGMSSFDVAPESVSGAGARLTGISADIDDAIGRIAGCSGAAEGTPLHGAFEGMLGQWSSALPHFGASSTSLSGALTGAAATYSGVDTALAAGTGEDP